MNATDDPAVPDDLGALLRGASTAQAVTPAPLSSVQRRARQRRRRRHGLVACGAAALVLLGGLALAQTTTDDGSEQVTASEPETGSVASVPQPLLVNRGIVVDATLEEALADTDGSLIDDAIRDQHGLLLELTPGGLETWWSPGAGLVPGGGAAVLADGRRFAMAREVTATGPTDSASIDEIGPDGRTLTSHELPSAAGAGIVGTSGNELILSRSTQRVGDLPEGTPSAGDPPQGRPLLQTTALSAYDVDTRAERPILDDDTGGLVSVASGVVARSNGTGCTIQVSEVSGVSASRTVDGGCPAGIEGMGGLAVQLAVSPDGRLAAVVWNQIHETGSPTMELAVIDLADGSRLVSEDVTDSSVYGMAWTGARELSVANVAPAPGVPEAVGPVTVRSHTFDDD